MDDRDKLVLANSALKKVLGSLRSREVFPNMQQNISNTLRQTDTQWRGRHRADEGECEYCDREREAGNGFHPPHDASANCRSGGHPHCSCDVCF